MAFGPDDHIPTRTKKNIIDTEFGHYFQSINCYVNDIPDHKISHLKRKLRNICKFRKIVEKLSRDISNGSQRMVMVEVMVDNGGEVVVIDSKTHTEKCLSLLNTDSFIELGYDPTKGIEGNIQRSMRKIKNNLIKQEYSRLYPTG